MMSKVFTSVKTFVFLSNIRKLRSLILSDLLGENMGFSVEVAAYLFIVVFIGYTIQTISGFGAIIFALPLSMIFVSRLEILPVFLIMSVFQSLAVAYRDKAFLNKKEFIVMFLLAMMGMPIGILMGDVFPTHVMNIALACFIIVNSVYSLKTTFKSSEEHLLVVKPYHRLYPFFSGFMQAAYGVGGPLIGTYMDKLTHNKKTYRSMISLYWCLLNPFIIIGYFTRGEIDTTHIKMFALLIPAVALGLIVGNRTVDLISKRKFQIFVHSLLIIIACTLFF